MSHGPVLVERDARREVAPTRVDLDGDEHLQVGDHVALVSDGVSLVAVITAIDADGTLHIALR